MPVVSLRQSRSVINPTVSLGNDINTILFRQLAAGDPACDLAIAWMLFHGESREAFRSTLRLDTSTWARARGWVLWKTLCAPVPGTSVEKIIADVIQDYRTVKNRK
jgi:hypothetical protein